MTCHEQKIQELISQGEGRHLAFHACTHHLDQDILETVCAFLNRNGGTLLLGVSKNGRITGIAPDSLEQLRREFVTAVSTAQQLTPPACLHTKTVCVDNTSLLVIQVPESRQVPHCHGRIYDRSDDGNRDITDSISLAGQLCLRKQDSCSENRVYTRVQPGDLRADLIERCRRYVRINHHPIPGWTWTIRSCSKAPGFYKWTRKAARPASPWQAFCFSDLTI